jgi:hypothetical protein
MIKEKVPKGKESKTLCCTKTECEGNLLSSIPQKATVVYCNKVLTLLLRASKLFELTDTYLVDRHG